MFDRIYFPALVFAALIGSTIAFAIDATRPAVSHSPQRIVQLERVVVVAKRVPAMPTIAAAATADSYATAVR
jgi:hypothetical protein